MLFDWRDSNESHNIIHVTLPDDQNALKTITGINGFNSGAAVTNNSFLHAFEEEGLFCVVSDGAPEAYCLINVLKQAQKTGKPELVNQEPSVLYKNHKVFLHCHTPASSIYYTLDGSQPTKLANVKFSHLSSILHSCHRY